MGYTSNNCSALHSCAHASVEIIFMLYEPRNEPSNQAIWVISSKLSFKLYSSTDRLNNKWQSQPNWTDADGPGGTMIIVSWKVTNRRFHTEPCLRGNSPPLESFYFDTACTTQTKLNQSTASKHISDTDHYLVCCELSKKVTKVVYYAMHIPFSVWGAVPSDPLLCVSPPNRILYDRDPAQAEPAPGNSLLSKSSSVIVDLTRRTSPCCRTSAYGDLEFQSLLRLKKMSPPRLLEQLPGTDSGRASRPV